MDKQNILASLVMLLILASPVSAAIVKPVAAFTADPTY